MFYRKNMNNEMINPWHFSNTDKNLYSPDGIYKIEFYELSEIAMGAPLGGTCYLIFDDKKIKLADWCGVPIIWNKNGNKIALPIWTKKRKQKIAIVDIVNLTITIYKREFRVLQFQNFIENSLLGVDSPIYMPKKVNFDIDKEEVEKIKELN